MIRSALKKTLMSPLVLKHLMNLYAPLRGAGIRVKDIAPDYSRLVVEMPLTRRNKNAVGTQFGGSLYAMADPFYMLLLMQRLGSRYLVWDQEATIRFVVPGKGLVRGVYCITEDQLNEIKTQAASGGKVLYTFRAQITHADGSVVAEVHKVLYIRLKPEFRPRSATTSSISS